MSSLRIIRFLVHKYSGKTLPKLWRYRLTLHTNLMKRNNALLLLFLLPLVAHSQADLLKQLENETKATTEYVSATFKGTRLINGQTVETKGKGALEFIFAH